jgi:thioredoxin:protein disulfide reductase
MKPTIVAIAACLSLCLGIVLCEESVVAVRPIAPSAQMEPGKTSVLNLDLEIAPPYHINSDRPLQDYLIPTTVELTPQQGVTFGKAKFPAAPLKKLPFSDSPLAVYDGTVRIAVDITPVAGLGSKEITVAGKVRYQACNDRYCLPPAAQAFSVKLPVAPGGPRVEHPAKEIVVNRQPAATNAAATSVVATNAVATNASSSIDFGQKNLAVIFFLVFAGGLALNLTPCVYPMIPITISYFGGQAQGKKGSIVAHSILYVIGMAVTYSILGVVAAMTGGLFGTALRYPSVLVGIALIMVLLALSMFDVYEFRMPQFLNRLAGSSQKGFAGTFLMGLTVGIVAAPCIGPFVLGLLTYVGNRGNAVLGFALFFVLALGMGVPFLILGMFSGSIRKLPRSGAWMIWVRKIFGFILLAMAVYFLQPLFPSALAYRCTFALIMLLAGIYLALIETIEGSGKAFAFVRNTVGIIFFGIALYSAVTGVGTYMEGISAQPDAGTVQWLPYSDAVFSRAAQESKPVFIDFYADWCAPCKELDKKTYSVPEVVLQSRSFIMLKVDLTSSQDAHVELLREKYQIRGVPTLVFLKPDGSEIAGLRGTGFESKEIFLEKMKKALEQSSGNNSQ